LVVTYSVDSAAGYPLTIDFYKADAGGQGRTYLSSDSISGPGQKTVILGSAAALGVATGDPLVATNTDFGVNTSEFSPAAAGYHTFLVTNTLNAGPGSLRQALLDAD